MFGDVFIVHRSPYFPWISAYFLFSIDILENMINDASVLLMILIQYKV